MESQGVQQWLEESLFDSDDDVHAPTNLLSAPTTPTYSDTGPDEEPDPAARDASPSGRPLDEHAPRLEGPRPRAADSLPRRAFVPGQLCLLEINPRAIYTRCLSRAARNQLPRGLQPLLDDLEAFAAGRAIIGRDAERALAKAAASDARFDWALIPGAYHVAGDEGSAGRTPSPAAVRRVLTAAQECDEKQHPQANWNLEVYRRVLDMAFRPEQEGSELGNLVDFMGCSTASAIGYYGPLTMWKVVDFCVYVEPKHDPSAAFEAGADHARTAMPGQTLNFTNFAPLRDRFVALSVEILAPGRDFDATRLEVGVWDKARWAFLTQLKRLHARVTGQKAGKYEMHWMPAPMPEFLPGIVVRGQDWFLVVTTTDGIRTELWHKVAIGSTRRPRDVYQLVRSLQRLGTWARDVHWPWLKATVEGIAAGAVEDAVNVEGSRNVWGAQARSSI